MSSCCGQRAEGGCCSEKGSKKLPTMDAELKSKAKATTGEVLEKKRTILDVVEELGPKLTDPNVSERLNAVTFLTEVLTDLKPDFLLAEEVSALLAFFTARLQDSVLLLSSTLKSLQFLISCTNFPDGAEKNLLVALFKEINTQSGSQDDRYRFYQILQSLMTKRFEGVKSMAIDFVLGFIQAMEGEKDPRCLMLVFEMFETIARQLPFDPLSDDMFEVIGCYFPILFEPPPNDPYGITAEDLSKRLRRCLTAHPKFGQLCAQLLEEQLREESAKTKRECFRLMEEALREFPPGAFAEPANIFWDEIRKQVMAPKADDLEQLALKCLESLVRSVAMGTDEDGRNSNLIVLIGQIFRDCEPFLANPEMQVMEPTNRMLLTASKADIRVAQQLASRTLPLLLEKYQTKPAAKKEYASMLLEWCRLLKRMESGSPLFTIRNAFISLLLDDMLLDPQSVRDLGFQIASCLLAIKEKDSDYLSDQDCLRIANVALESAISAIDGHQPALIYLRDLATHRWLLIENQILPILESKLNETTKFLRVLASLIIDSSSAKLILPRILNSLTVIRDGDHQSLIDSIDALRLVLEFNSGDQAVLMDGLLDNDDWRRMCEGVRIAAEELAMMADTGGSNEKGKSVFERVCDLAQDVVLYGGSLENFVIDELLDGISISDFAAVSPSVMLVYIERIVAAMSAKEIQNRFKPSAIVWQVDGADENSKNSAGVRIARINACIVNKLLADRDLKTALENAIEKANSTLNADGILSYAWLCKAMLIRNLQPYADKMFGKVIDSLNTENPDMAGNAVEALRIILGDNPDAPLLSIRTRAQISLLAKQRIFSRAVNLLTSGFDGCSVPDRKRYYFQALHIILTYAPKTSQCDTEIDKLLPLLLNAIQSDDQQVLVSSVNSLKQLITNATSGSSQKLHPHIPGLCSRLVELAKSKSSPMDLRSSALDCITELADKNRIPAIILNPWRDMVLKQLVACLDDRKRFVRSKAVAARNKWFVMG